MSEEREKTAGEVKRNYEYIMEAYNDVYMNPLNEMSIFDLLKLVNKKLEEKRQK